MRMRGEDAGRMGGVGAVHAVLGHHHAHGLAHRGTKRQQQAEAELAPVVRFAMLAAGGHHDRHARERDRDAHKLQQRHALAHGNGGHSQRKHRCQRHHEHRDARTDGHEACKQQLVTDGKSDDPASAEHQPVPRIELGKRRAVA